MLQRLHERSAHERVFLKVDAGRARAAADASDARRRSGNSLGPLDGVIVSVKDVFDVAGETTLAGSAMRLSEPPAGGNSAVVQRLLAAGAILLGRNNQTEFCFTSEGINRHFGTPGNACDPGRIPGGSSSGAGVSVAEGTSEIAIGTDTGGSVRIPAALNGVVGFKPTARRIPLDGIFPLSPTLDSVGPLARTVADCAAADAILAGEAPADFPPAGLSALVLGVPEGVLLDRLDEAVAVAFDGALRRLGAAGARIVQFDVEGLLAAMRDLTRKASLASVEAAAIHADWLRRGQASVDPRVAGPLSRRLAFPAADYRRMLERRRELARAMDERLSAIDALALPTVPIVAPPLAPLLADDDLADVVDDKLLRNTQVVNQFDLTAISLPMPGDGLPTSLMLVARSGADRRLLTIAQAVERCLAG